MPLDSALARVPGLAGYLGAEQFRQDQAIKREQLGAILKKKAEDEQIAGVMKSSATPEEAMQNLSRIGPHGVAAATQLAQLREHQGKADLASLVNSGKIDMTDPATLDRLALKDPRYEAFANRAREKQAAATQLATQRGVATTIQPDPQEAEQSADQGTPTVAPVTTYKGGIFDGLTQSPNEQIAAQATQLKSAMEKAGPGIPPQYWQNQQSQLAARETALLNRPEKNAEPLVAVATPDGKGKLVPRSEAQGLSPHSPSMAGAGLLEPESLKLAAEQYLAGDRQAIQGYARNAQARAALQNEITKQARAKGWSGADIAAQVADFSGTMAGSRTTGQRAAQIALAATEAEKMIDVALERSKAFDRTNFVPVNKALVAFANNTGTPEARAFGTAVNSLVNVYARAISPSGVPTVSDKDHAREILSTADSPEQFKAAIDVMRQELKIAKSAPREVQEATRARVAPGGAPAAAAATVAAPGGIPEFATETDIPKNFKGRAKVGGKIGTVN